MFRSWLTRERITIIKELPDWPAAVRGAAAPLLADGSIEEKYLAAVFATIETAGPYMVLADGVALLHADSESGAGQWVRESALSMLRTDAPIDFMGRPVRLWLFVAAAAPADHMAVLTEFATRWPDAAFADIFMDGTPDAIVAMLAAQA